MEAQPPLKIALVSEDGDLFIPYLYSNNNGSPLATAIRSIQEIYASFLRMHISALPCLTGYGVAFIKVAFKIDDLAKLRL